MAANKAVETNEGLYGEIVKELSKSFEFLATLIVENKFVITNAHQVKKLMDKDQIRYHDDMANLCTSIDLYNAGIENVVMYIRSSGLGELEDIARYLENCVIPDFYEALSQNSWIESKDVSNFQKKLSVENISRMLNDITDIACNDCNAAFLRHFRSSKLWKAA